ncbi:MAG: MarR family transcriptional regulator [Opitutales bacterium]|nr:MarR family transcriptional regulator [Opitutales bacterium]NRA26978.1 MarR family transcriptional regulator [Opitutales bacterium]
MQERLPVEDVVHLTQAVRRAYHRFRHLSDQLHGDLGITGPKRALLLLLAENGPMTVPALAGERFVSRQIIQTQINQLLSAKLVEAQENPHHKRSQLIALSEGGEQMIQSMMQREHGYINQLSEVPSLEAIRTTCDVLDYLYTDLKDPE